VAALVLTVAVAAEAADDGPSQFVRSSSRDGFTSFETGSRAYRHRDGSGPTVSLVGAVHIGDKSYYDKLVELLETHDVVLYESVLPRGAFGTGGGDDLERQRSTQDAMLFLRGLMAEFARANGTVPASLAELRAFIVGRDTRLARPLDLARVDAWGSALDYQRTGPLAFRLASLGANASMGGRDFELDLVLDQLPARVLEKIAKASADTKHEERRDLYGELADALDTNLQVRSINYDRATWLPADLPMEELLDRLWKRGERSATLEMLSSQNGLQQGIVRFLLSLVSKSPAFKKIVIEAMGSAGAAASGRNRSGLGAVDERIILDERNDAVIERLRALLAQTDAPKSVAIFYGAAHMGDFESTLREEFALEPAETHWFRAMAAEEWSAGKIDARIKKLQADREAMTKADPAGAYPACERVDTRIAELQERRARIQPSG
jgi:hypothetical protein